MKSRERKRTWFDEEEVTIEVTPLGVLVETPAKTLLASEPLVTARQLLIEHRIAAIVVVDDRRTVVGVVTRTDVLRGLAKCSEATVGDAMSGFVFALPQTARVEHAAALMAHEQVGQVVVTGDDGELVGLVSALDIAGYLAVRAGFLAA
jgi:CBS domain-containing protein